MSDGRRPIPFTFDRVRGQARAIEKLREAVSSERVPQAYLFHGTWGVGKTTTALALAAALNCEAEPAKRPCGTCLPCRKTAGFNHPDVRFLMPLFPAALWKEDAEKGSADEPGLSPVSRIFSEWTRDPVYVFRWPKRASIATEWVLETKRESSRKTFEGRTKVIVFSGVETMGVEASNRILKMLEEPGPHTVFILTTSRLHQVLPTIRSRCQRLPFGEIPRDIIRELLITHHDVPPDAAAHVAALAGGSVARAASFLEEGILDIRGWTLGLMKLEGEALLDRLSGDVLGQDRRWDVGRVRHVAEVLMTWYRDLLAVKHGLPDDRIANRDHLDTLRAQAARVDPGDVRTRVARVELLIEALEHQVTPSLALFSMLTETLTGPEAAPLP